MPVIRSHNFLRLSSSLFNNKSLLFRNKKILEIKNVSKLYEFTKCLSTTCFLRQTNLVTDNLDGKLIHSNGIVKLVLDLPARKEKCEFSLKLLNENVGNLVEHIKQEDKSIEKIVFYNNEGLRISQSTPIGLLVINPFSIKINESLVKVDPPESLSAANNSNQILNVANQDLEQIRQLVSKLYLHLNIAQYEAEKEAKIQSQIEQLKSELAPLEKVRIDLEIKAKKHTNRMIWFGLGLMSIQAGVLARLTWFDYSWDIVEPISYFVSYSAVIGVYAYYVLTRKEYGYESASDRIYLRHFHKNAIKNNLNISKYNQIKDNLYDLENELKKIKETSSVPK